MLLTLVIVYLLITIAIGLVAAKRVKNSADFAIAGRHLPLYMIVTTTFATWFGSETVLGIPAKFIEGGLGNVVEDPFGAGFCLILVGLFFAGKLYRMTLLTISDYYRERYGRGIEVVCSLIIILSYLGWVSAQVTALGLVFNLLSGGTISIPVGMVLGTASILAYTLFGGMWSVAVTDFIQMIILVVGLAIIAVFAAGQAGGAGHHQQGAARQAKSLYRGAALRPCVPPSPRPLAPRRCPTPPAPASSPSQPDRHAAAPRLSRLHRVSHPPPRPSPPET